MTEHLRFLLTGVEATRTPMLDLYADLHQHPELSGMEERTAATVGAALAHAGMVVTPRVGGHGVVGLLHNGVGPTVMLRAELDALPMLERTGLGYASEESHDGVPVMHACGHDLHLAALCGAVEVLAAARSRWCGTVIAVGQPAAETLKGAADMLADGLFYRFGWPNVVLAQHIAAFPAGCVAHPSGPATAGGVTLEITVPGNDPVPIVTRLSGLFHSDHVALTVGPIRAVADRDMVISAGLRSLSTAALDHAVGVVLAEVRDHCVDFALTADTPAGDNDPWTAARVRGAHLATFGESRVLGIAPALAAEDFALYGACGVPTAYWTVGCVSPRVWTAAQGCGLPVNHSPDFAPDPVPTLRTATAALVAAAWSALAAPRPDSATRNYSEMR